MKLSGILAIVLTFVIRVVSRLCENHTVMRYIGYAGFFCSLLAGIAVVLKILPSDICPAVSACAFVYALASYLRVS